MVQFKFRGLMAPVLTPFNNDKERSLNLDVIPKYAQFLSTNEIKGILVNGTSGEGMSMSVAERKVVTEVWVKAAKETKQTLMIQVGGAPLPDVIELTKHAESLKVDSILCLPELFFKPKSVDELIDYLQIVSESAPSVPLLYYHNPPFSGVDINMADFLMKAMGKIPTLVGIKFTSLNLLEGAACLEVQPPPVVFLGADQILAGGFSMGFDSVIATSLNMLPSLSQNIMLNVNNGVPVKALSYQRKLTKAINIIIENGSWVSGMKAAMNEITNIYVGPTRAPLKPLSDCQSKLVRSKLNAEGYALACNNQ